MSDEVGGSKSPRQVAAERVAFEHLVMVRLHLEALIGKAGQSGDASFSSRSIVALRHAFVDVRMVIEELMLLSVSAHKDAGEDVAKSLRKVYQADKKMARLRAINPRFFPDAIEVVPTDDADVDGRFVRVECEYLSEEEAKSYYNRCGAKLHASWQQMSAESYFEERQALSRFIELTSRLLDTFEIDISGQGYIMLGHLNLGEAGPPSLFFARKE